ACALVWVRVHDRRVGHSGPGLAGPSPRGHGRTSPERGAPLVRQAAFSDRLPHQGTPDRGETPVSIHSPPPIRRLLQGGASALLAAAALLMLAPVHAGATTIERVVTPAGIEVWLVRGPTVPLIAIDFGFRGGSVQDPQDKGGTANMMVSLLDEGAGD